MIYVFTGKDDFSQREALNEIKASLDGDGMLSSNTTAVDGKSVSAAELESICMTVPFLSAHRLVIAEGLLSRFEAQDSPGKRRKKAAKQQDAAPWEELAERLKSMPPSTTLVLVDGDVKATNPLLALLKPIAEVRNFAPLSLRGREIAGWIEQRARKLGIAIVPKAAERLASLIGNDLWTLASELGKLAAYAQGRRVEEADVLELVSSMREANVFAMADAAIEGRTPEATNLVRRLLEEGESPQRLLSLLATQYRRLVRVKEMLDAGASAYEVGSKLSLPPFAVDRTLAQARRYSMDGLKGAYRRLLDADLNIKRGIHDEETSLYLLVQELASESRGSKVTGRRS